MPLTYTKHVNINREFTKNTSLIIYRFFSYFTQKNSFPNVQYLVFVKTPFTHLRVNVTIREVVTNTAPINPFNTPWSADYEAQMH